jgi:hypothetical protein
VACRAKPPTCGSRNQAYGAGINTAETFEVAILARTGLVLATLKECTLSLGQGFDHQHLRHHRGRWVRWPY